MILILILHLIKKYVASFVWISCLHLIFSINLMTACLWNVLKCLFSLASDLESIRISFTSLQNYFVDRSLPGGLSFWMLFRESCTFFSVKSSSKRFGFIFREFWNFDMTEKTFNFCHGFLFAFFKKNFVEFF